MPRTANKSNKKESQVKKKVSELLDGIDLTAKQKKEVSKVVELENKSGDEWLEAELDRVTEENERLRAELAKAIQSAPKQNVTADSVIQQKVHIFFKEMEGILTGRNPKQTPFRTVETKYVLDRLLFHFHFLRPKK